MRRAMNLAGLVIEGKAHRALDDAKNIISGANALPDWDELRLAKYLAWLDAVALKCSEVSKPLYDFYIDIRVQHETK
ncbi:hypothetical protein [Colwellia sp. E150_009]